MAKARVERKAVLQALKGLKLPDGSDAVAAGMIRALNIGPQGDVRFVIEPGSALQGQSDLLQALRQQAEKAVMALEGVGKVRAVVAAAAPGHQMAGPGAPPSLGSAAAPAGPQPIEGVDHVIAVASGKGGVGKSTVCANLAVALAAEGRRVGLLDADVFGPSQPRMLGVSGRPSSPDGKTILPLRNHGVTLMSVGLMRGEDEAVVWRGPMLLGALQQMLGQVQWGRLDILLVDLPPGTGDVPMSLAQKARLDGAIIVSTPQDIALLDVRKGLDMFDKMRVRILGMIENMSTHICSRCGHEEHLFGHGGVAEEAARIGVPLLAELPLSLAVRQAADGGAPIVASAPGSDAARAFRELARRLIGEGVA